MEDDRVQTKTGFPQSVAALKHRNFRLFWFGQCISLIGTWMQNAAQAWLVLELTKSAFWLGTVSAIQFLPMLLLSLFAGALIDRLPKKKMLLFTQTLMMILAFILAFDIMFKTVTLWHVLVIAGLLGVANTLDMPTRQAFMIELVGSRDLMNAIVLNSSVFNAARILGPTAAGIFIDKFGMDWCFFVNAASFIPVIAGIGMITLKKQESHDQAQKVGVIKDIKEGLHYIKNSPAILVPMSILTVISIFAMNFNVLVPLYAKNIFHGGARSFGFLMSANGVGALIGSALLATRSGSGPKTKYLVLSAMGIGVFELLLVPVKVYGLAYLLLGLVGLSMITFSTTANSMVQVNTPHNLRGRVMSVYTLLFAGLTPIGSFLSGSAAHLWGAPATMGLGGLISLICILFLLIRFPTIFRINRPSELP